MCWSPYTGTKEPVGLKTGQEGPSSSEVGGASSSGDPHDRAGQVQVSEMRSFGVGHNEDSWGCPLLHHTRRGCQDHPKRQPRVTQALIPGGTARSLTSPRLYERGKEAGEQSPTNLLLGALCKLAPFPAYHSPIEGGQAPPQPFRSPDGFSGAGEWRAN